MPKILLFKYWIFIIFDTDKYENRKHVHVGKKSTENLCKIWLETLNPNESEVSIAEGGDLTVKQQNEVLKIAELYRQDLIKQWDNFMNGVNIKAIKITK